MKVLHLPTPTGGNAWGLAQAEKKLGLEATVLYKYQNWLTYPCDIALPDHKNICMEGLALLKAAWSIKDKYDVYHFNFGQSLANFPNIGLELLDLPLYKKKKIFVTYNGCDARQKDRRRMQDKNCACGHDLCGGDFCNSSRQNDLKRKQIAKFERYATGFFSLNPDLMYFLPDKTVFLPYTVANWEEIEVAPKHKGKDLVIVHAPTNRIIKGTDTVMKCMEELNKRYSGKIKLALVENMPHEEAIRAYREADIIIDQLKIGWYGAFAVEAMKMGKPVVVYINEDDLHFIPEKMEKDCKEAIINANEGNLYEVLAELIENPTLLQRKIEAQQEYVNRWHNPAYVGGITKRAYEG